MKIRKKGLLIGVMAVLMISILVPVYAQTQSGDPVQDRDQICDAQGQTVRAFGEEKPETPEGALCESEGEQIKEQTQTQEKLRDCGGDAEEGKQYQYQYKYQDQLGQEEENPEEGIYTQEQTQNQEQKKEGNTENEGSEQFQYQYKYQDQFGKEE